PPWPGLEVGWRAPQPRFLYHQTTRPVPPRFPRVSNWRPRVVV
ncbi:unnamed protein product, partial [Brassica oleracea var. botrytis]